MRAGVCFAWLFTAAAYIGLTVAAQAGVIQGTVVERATGHVLARTVVRLQTVPTEANPAPKSFPTRTNRNGGFSFIGVTPGYYTIIAERPGFFPAEYGQRRPTGYGTPVLIGEDTEVFAALQMGRMASISGTVLDQNAVGIPGVHVVAYHAELPLRAVAEAVTDDRGVYRIAGLETGNYWVRTASHTLEDGSGLLPTFAREGDELRDARTQRAEFDRETILADIYPLEGRLFTLSGQVLCGEPNGSIEVVLSSETGRKVGSTICGGGIHFEGLSPGDYEVIAEFREPLKGGGFARVSVERDAQVSVAVSPPPRIRFFQQSGAPLRDGEITLMARRDDLSGISDAEPFDWAVPTLTPGYWLIQADVGPGSYLAAVLGTSGRVARYAGDASLLRTPADWFDITVEAERPSQIRLLISDQGGELAGVVHRDGVSVPGAPVTLLAVDPTVNRQAGGQRSTIADKFGRFRFESLPPGDYRILSTFDERNPKAATFQEAKARVVEVTAKMTTDIELEQWLAP